MSTSSAGDQVNGQEIAIIGMAGRFPGAWELDRFWKNLRDGVESICLLSDEELLGAGVEPESLLDPAYVRAVGRLEGSELFDADFFAMNPREAEITDPQHRLFLECAWQALEDAGYNAGKYSGSIGMYAGAGVSGYVSNLLGNAGSRARADGLFQTVIANSSDHLTTRVAFKLDFRGPCITVQTACSTSLVAVHLACQGLLNMDCDIALAGGVRLVAHKAGHRYQEGGILSPDGHCRAFDASAQGTINGEGVGIIVLKRLAEAFADGDAIRAVIKGSAINNDGALKVGYTAPSVQGQARLIRRAQVLAEVEPQTISYVEAHGTGTVLGDPVEFAALTHAFRAATQETGFCAIGSVKTNIGHLDAAAGIAGLIKCVLALNHRLIPPMLNYTQPNPHLNLNSSPFYINRSLRPWESNGAPRRAAVSSFGIGGTNSHVILEEAPKREAGTESRTWQLLPVSARTPSALKAATENLVSYLQRHPEIALSDVAYTLQVGRKSFDQRSIFLCANDNKEAVRALLSDGRRACTDVQKTGERPVVFMFPGQGAQYVNMGRELYEKERAFRRTLDHCFNTLKHIGEVDAESALFPKKQSAEGERLLAATAVAQVSLFAIEYSLAELWIGWGIRPHSMIGHSIGECVAACVAGVLSLEDALRLVAVRGKLMQAMPEGAMTSVALSESEVGRIIDRKSLWLAAVNSPLHCVISGSLDSIRAVESDLSKEGVEYRRLRTSHAYHSGMMAASLDQFILEASRIEFKPPKVPYISNVTGDWITEHQATDPHYWASHIVRCVQFSNGIKRLTSDGHPVFLEVGPGNSLSTLVRHHSIEPAVTVLGSLRHPDHSISDQVFVMDTFGRLWLAGINVDWEKLYRHERRRRVSLPTYSFERQRYWAGDSKPLVSDLERMTRVEKRRMEDWFYIPCWKECYPRELVQETDLMKDDFRWLIFVDSCGLGSQLAMSLRRQEWCVVTVAAAEHFARVGEGCYTINPGRREEYSILMRELRISRGLPNVVAHFWNVTGDKSAVYNGEGTETALETAFFSLLFLAQALAEQPNREPIRLGVIANHLHSVLGKELLCPEKATTLGPCQVMGQELENIKSCCIDVEISEERHSERKTIARQVLDELMGEMADQVVAYRGDKRWIPFFERIVLKPSTKPPVRLRKGGTYLITGGLGGIGLVLAEYLASAVKAKLVLVGRSRFPERHEWDNWIAANDADEPTSLKIHKIRELERIGSPVMIVSADVTELSSMKDVVRRATAEFGQINGIIHSAGIPGGGLIELKTRDAATRVLDPKVTGTRVLDALFRETQVDFLALCSSFNSFRPAPGQVDYCAANAFLDAFAHSARHRSGTPVVAINWAPWQEVGMAAHLSLPAGLDRGREGRLDLGILPSQGKDAFSRILPTRFSQVVVFPVDLAPANGRDLAGSYLQKPAKDKAAPGGSAPRNETQYLGSGSLVPKTKLERVIADIWQDLFGISDIGLKDDFFELGGHSLLATRLVSRIREAIGEEIPLGTLFANPTIAGLAAAVIGARKEDLSPAPPPIRRAERHGELPLSFSQQRLWFADQLDPNSAAYHIPLAVKLEGPLNVAALWHSLQRITERHEVLRTRYEALNGRTVQVLDEETFVEFRICDIHALHQNQGDHTTIELGRQDAARLFDMERGPVFRASLIRRRIDVHVLLICIHHIAADGWSLYPMVKELISHYEAYAKGERLILPDLPVQYLDYAVWQREWIQGPVLEEQSEYWRRQLSGAPALIALPVDRSRSAARSSQGAHKSVYFTLDLRDGLVALSQREGATLFMTLLAAFKTLLYRLSAQDDIVVGTNVANRRRVELEGLIGFFVNNLVLRTSLAGNPTFRELLARVREVCLAAYSHQDIPFETVVEALKPERAPSHNPLFQVLFVLQNNFIPELKVAGLTLTQSESNSNASGFDILLNMRETDLGLLASLTYRTELFDDSTIDQMLTQYGILMEHIVENPEETVDRLALARSGTMMPPPGFNDNLVVADNVH
jgi:acyl transferase domain-containing protein